MVNDKWLMVNDPTFIISNNKLNKNTTSFRTFYCLKPVALLFIQLA